MTDQKWVEITIPKNHNAHKQDFHYPQRTQWVRAVVIGANDGLASIASLVMGVRAVQKDVKAMTLTWLCLSISTI